MWLPGIFAETQRGGRWFTMVHMETDNDPVQEEPAQSPQSSPEPSPEPSPRFKQSIKSIYQDIHKTQLLTCLHIICQGSEDTDEGYFSRKVSVESTASTSSSPEGPPDGETVRDTGCSRKL